MSSLAKQLKQLQIPGLHVGAAAAKTSKKVSLLFDASEASDIDSETIFSLGINGLEELKSIDASFGQFEVALFNESSKALERTVQTKGVNDKLDKEITKFLRFLSPYVLLKPAHKTLEWLIRRYQIHVFNVSELVSSVLPYHETKFFARIVQLLAIADPSSKWNWLHPLQKAGSPLPRSALLQRCITDSSFFFLVCDLVNHLLDSDVPASSSRTLLTFYCSTVVGCLEIMDRVSEEFLGRLVPYVFRGLKAGIPDLRAASLMVVGQLCVKCALEEKLVKSLIENICKHLTQGLISEGIMSLSYICQTQAVKKLPRKALHSLMKFPDLVQHLSHLASGYDASVFLSVLLSQLVSLVVKEAASGEEGNLENLVGSTSSILKGVELEDALIVELTRTLLEEYTKACDRLGGTREQIKPLNQSIQGLAQLLEKRYPVQLEMALEEFLHNCKTVGGNGTDHDGADPGQWAVEFISVALSGVKSQIVPDSSTTLTLSLNHPKAQVRQMAVKHLAQIAPDGESVAVDGQFVVDSLLARVEDDDPSVVLAVLELEEALLGKIPTEILVKKLFLLMHRKSEKWEPVQEKAMSLLVGKTVSAADPVLCDEVVCGLLQFLFLQPKIQRLGLSWVKIVVKSPLAAKHPLLTGMKSLMKKKEWKGLSEEEDPTEMLAAANAVLVMWLRDQLIQLPDGQRLAIVQSMANFVQDPSSSNLSITIINCILGSLVASVAKETKLQLYEVILEVALPQLLKITDLQGPTVELPEEFSVEALPKVVPLPLLTKVITLLGKHSTRRLQHVSAAVTLWLCRNLVKSLHTVWEEPIAGQWWQLTDTDSLSGRYTKILLRIFQVLASGAGSCSSSGHQAMFKQALQELFQHHLPDKLQLLKFLSLVWTSSTPQSSPSAGDPGPASQCPALLQVQSLHIGSMCLSSLNSSLAKELLQTSCTVIPSILATLSSPITAIRRAAVSCLKKIGKLCTSVQPSPVTALIIVLLESAEELSTDPSHIQRLLSDHFSSLSVKSPHSTGSAKIKAKKKAEERTIEASLDYALKHALSDGTPLHVQRRLLLALNGVVTQSFLLASLPKINELLSKSEQGLVPDEAVCLQLLLRKYTVVTAPLLEIEVQTWEVMLKAMKGQRALCPGHPSPLLTMLNQITNSFFQAITSPSIQQNLLRKMLDILVATKDAELGNKIKAITWQVSFTAEQISEELCRGISAPEEGVKRKKAKRASTAIGGGTSEESDREWRRLRIFLELLQRKVNTADSHRLVPTLFALLARCIALDASEQASMEYTKQLLLSQILTICQKLSPDGTPVRQDLLPEASFDVELVVRCVRVSDSPQTHHQALLLLAMAANLFPEKVLHNIMSIFTFMGASVMRQDDSYSFQVIRRTVETVIPALVQAGEKQLPTQSRGRAPAIKLDSVVAMVMRVFVDASPHMPEHRQLPLFTHLVSTVGAARFLHAALILLLERDVVHGVHAPHDTTSTTKSPGLDFCLSLCHHFEPEVQVEAMLKLLTYIANLPEEKEESARKPRVTRKPVSSFSAEVPLFDVGAHSARHLRQLKFQGLGLIPSLFSSQGFTDKVAEQETVLDSAYLGVLEETLSFLTRTAKTAESHSQDASAKFWRALMHRACDIIDKVNQLLPNSAFLSVIRRLVHNTNATVKKKAMELLNDKLGKASANYSDDQVTELLQLVDELASVAQGEGEGTEVTINRQTALYSLKILTRMLASEHPDRFKQVLSITIEIISDEESNVQVVSSSLLCLGEVCAALQAHAISALPQFMPLLLKQLKSARKDSPTRNGMLLLCAVTAVHKVTEALANFLSPYLVDLLRQVCNLSCVESESGEKQDGANTNKSSVQVQLHSRLASLRKEIPTRVPVRLLVPAVSECYSKLVEGSGSADALCVLMDILSDCVSGMNREEVNTYHSQLFTFILVALDFRVLNQDEPSDLVDSTEASIINAFLCLVMKLSEASFRPMFLKLVDWGTRSSSPKERLLVFYRLCDSVADRLKSLFVLFAGYIVKNCASLLNANNSAKAEERFFQTEGDADVEKSDRKSSVLVTYILDCLYKCCLYDTQGFLDQQRFTCLMQPLVDQIENQTGGKDVFQERVSRNLVPCLAQLAVTAGKDAHWKPLNYQVLLKTRHSSPQVRFAALKVLEQFNQRLGDEFMVLLPETIPFLAELMEDECFEVEQECQQLVSQIEEVLGESLQKYF